MKLPLELGNSESERPAVAKTSHDEFKRPDIQEA